MGSSTRADIVAFVSSQRTLAVSVLGLFVVFAGIFHVPIAAQQTGPKSRPLIIASMSGRDLFEFYCTACHGRDGKGGGPVAGALRVAPPDLTMIAARNGGVFPKARVEALVSGEPDMPPPHGSQEMPVWGPIFRALAPNDRMNRVRIVNIVEYIASIQTK